jgi:hypothetical protein
MHAVIRRSVIIQLLSFLQMVLTGLENLRTTLVLLSFKTLEVYM